jgi:hypothetical protein
MRALLILGALAIVEGLANANQTIIAAGGIALMLALLVALIELIAPLR